MERPTHSKEISKDREGPLQDQGIRGERGQHLPCLLRPWRACWSTEPEPSPFGAPPAMQVLGLSPGPTQGLAAQVRPLTGPPLAKRIQAGRAGLQAAPAPADVLVEAYAPVGLHGHMCSGPVSGRDVGERNTQRWG